MSKIRDKFSTLVYEKKKEYNVYVKDLSKMTNVGKNSIQRVVFGGTTCSLETAVKLAKCLDISLDELIQCSDVPSAKTYKQDKIKEEIEKLEKELLQ